MKFDWSSPAFQQFNLLEKTFAENYAADTYQAFFFAYLLKKTIEGTLSIKIEAQRIDPLLKLEPDFEQQVIQSISSPNWPVIKVGNEYFLHRFYVAYQACLNRLGNFTSQHEIDQNQLQVLLQKYRKENVLNEEQLEAIYRGVLSPFFMLTGGPGTGKTFTAARLLNTLWNCLAVEKKPQFSVAVVAPTGKAANHLLASLKKGITDEDLSAKLTAKTLHSLLKYNPNKTDEEVEPVVFDLVLVDEASMIDVELMAALCRKLKPLTRLILIGDPFQLPPVEGPGIFPILLKSGFTKVALKTCLRVESTDLIGLSQAIYREEAIQESANVKLLDISQNEFVEQFHEKFLVLKEGFSALQKFCILSPTKKGIWGTEALNQLFLKALKKKEMSQIPLLLTANDYSLDLFNGELGLMNNNEVLFANDKRIPLLFLKSYELGFAMTIHKSQGSEFEEVVLILPPSEKSYSKELLYTAVTRAKRKLYIVKPLTIL